MQHNHVKPDMHPAPSLKDCYPPKILEWIKELRPPAHATEQQKRMARILEDREVIIEAAPIFDQLDTLTSDAASERINNFWLFIEDAAELPDSQPVGAALRDGRNPPEFLTAMKLRVKIAETARTSQKLADLITSIASTIAGSFSIQESREMIAKLNSLNDTCMKKAHKHRLKDDKHGDYEYPIYGSTAGEHSWRNWLAEQLAIRSEVRLGKRPLSLITAIVRVLLNAETSMTEDSLRKNIGIRTQLAPELAEDTFNTWAIKNNYPTKP